jgi:hypothetical protein
MKQRKMLVPFLASFAVLAACEGSPQGFAQEFEPGEVLPELTTEQKIDRLTGNLNALVFAVLNYAEMHGQSIEEAGRYVGEVSANSWPADATPEFYVAAMNRNHQMFDLRTEVLEVGDDYVKARRDRIQFSDELEEAYQRMFGYGMSDYKTFYRYIEIGITSKLGLAITHRVEDEHVVFTVSVSQ